MAVYIASAAILERSGHEVGRQLLAQLWEAHVGGEMSKIAVGPMGKPYFVSAGWHFSISHTPRHAFCALADRPVGLDAEELDRDVRLAIAPKILSDGELAQFQTAEDPRKTLLTFWVLKEAQGKLSGEGIKWHPTHTNFQLPDPRVTELDGCLVAVVY